MNARGVIDGGGAVLLVGPAGIGKTTMTGHIVQGRRHVLGQSLGSLDTVAYHPLSHALRVPLHGTPADVAAEVSARLEGRVLVIEDAHWADEQTLAAVALLARRVPMVVTSRTSVPALPTNVHRIDVPGLDRRAARALARRMHPTLDTAGRETLVSAAGGNPLLIRELASTSDVSPTLADAVKSRLSGLSTTTVDGIAKLALFGRPAPAQIVGWENATEAGGLVTLRDGHVELTHALVAEVLVGLLDAERITRLHREIALRCDDADAARHFLAAGDRASAAEAALRAADTGDASMRAARLHLAVEASGDDASDRLRLDAARALIHAHRTKLADEVAASVSGNERDVQAEAAWCRSQAAWLDGDVARAVTWRDHGLQLVAGTGSAIEVHLLVERAEQIVRLNIGDRSSVEIAHAARDHAERTGVDRARALSTLGLALAHTGQPGWDEQYDEAAQVARDEGDHEQECAARYWAASAYGMYGPMHKAVAIDEQMLARAAELGQRRWVNHFLGALAVHRLGTGNGNDELLERCRRLLVDDPLFRNRAQVDMAVAVAMIDRGDLVGATDVLATGRRFARHDEDRSLIAVAAAELAYAGGDVDGVVAALRELGSYQRGFFGMNAAAESAAIHCALQTGANIDIPSMSTVLMPVLNAVDIERDALSEHRAGRASAAFGRLEVAATVWLDRGFLRFAARAWYGASEVARRSGEGLDAERALVHAEALCSPTRLVPTWRLIMARRAADRQQWVATTLTRRELEVLGLVARGMTSAAIAHDLQISQSTVDTHVDAARLKLGATTRTQAAAIASGW